MSDDKKKRLTETLTQLNQEERVWAINYLVQLLVTPSSERRKVKVVNKNHSTAYTNEQWEEYFKGQLSKELSDNTQPLSSVLKATSGKTIKPLEKWL